MQTLQARIDQWTADQAAALVALTEAENTHARAAYELAYARATAERQIRDQAATDGRKLTEGAIAAAVALDANVQVCEHDALDAAGQLVQAKHDAEIQRGIKAALSWQVALVTQSQAA